MTAEVMTYKPSWYMLMWNRMALCTLTNMLMQIYMQL